MNMEWENQKEDIKDYVGFVYLIYNLRNDKFYIGQKVYWNKIRRKPLKGYKRIRKDVRESDWKKYYGSSEALKEDVKKYGEENFRRVILHHCKDKWDMTYKELMEQIDRKVLFNPRAYNGIINVRLKHRKGEI